MMTSSQHPLFQLSTIPLFPKKLPVTAGKLSLRPSLGPDLGPGKPGGAREDAAGVGKGVTGLARSPLLTAPERPWAGESSCGKEAVGNKQN